MKSNHEKTQFSMIELNPTTNIFSTKNNKQRDYNTQNTIFAFNTELQNEDTTLPVSYTNWARTRRQRVIQNISFESEEHNIYSPQFTSRNSGASLSSTGSRVSVPRERDFVTMTHMSGFTPNMSVADVDTRLITGGTI